MDVAGERADEQTRLWNGVAGRAWVDTQELLDRVFEPVRDLLVEGIVEWIRAESASRVLDVGCGTGGTTLAAARAVGPAGRCVGVDISEPMIAAARARAEREDVPAHFVCADAQTHEFEPASFDVMMSRFGVMFFDDPVRAFANLRRAGTDAAMMRFIAWRSPAENPFMTTAERAAAPLVPDIAPRRPGAPGQFAFADPQRVDQILQESGWEEIVIRPVDIECAFPEPELARYFTRLGPLGMVLDQADEQTRARVVELVRPAFDPFVHGADVRFAAACWMVSARAAAASHRRATGQSHPTSSS